MNTRRGVHASAFSLHLLLWSHAAAARLKFYCGEPGWASHYVGTCEDPWTMCDPDASVSILCCDTDVPHQGEEWEEYDSHLRGSSAPEAVSDGVDYGRCLDSLFSTADCIMDGESMPQCGGFDEGDEGDEGADYAVVIPDADSLPHDDVSAGSLGASGTSGLALWVAGAAAAGLALALVLGCWACAWYRRCRSKGVPQQQHPAGTATFAAVANTKAGASRLEAFPAQGVPGRRILARGVSDLPLVIGSPATPLDGAGGQLTAALQQNRELKRELARAKAAAALACGSVAEPPSPAAVPGKPERVSSSERRNHEALRSWMQERERHVAPNAVVRGAESRRPDDRQCPKGSSLHDVQPAHAHVSSLV